MAKEITQPNTTFYPQNGGLIADFDARNVPNGGLYLTSPESGALNVRAVGDQAGVSPDYENILGNELVYEGDVAVVQNRIFRLRFTWVTLSVYELNIYSPNGLIGTTLTIASGANVTAAYNNIVAAINLISTATASALTITNVIEGEFTIEFTDVPYWDYNITSEPAFGNNLLVDINILQEAVDASMLGDWRLLGSDDRTGDQWTHWTTRTTLPVEFIIENVTDNGAGLIRIETTIPHNILTDFSVQVKNVGGVPNANGIWIATFVDATHVDLQGSTFAGAYTSGGTITSYIFGLGEIGVGVKDENDQTWDYTRLLRSKEFNFVTLKQHDIRVKRKQDLNKADYFVDAYNPDRVFYYKGAYITDGGLEINGGHYTYGSIAAELVLEQNSLGFNLRFVNQIQTGGNILSGNWRYAARFTTEAGISSTVWSFLTNPVNATQESEDGSGYQMFGRPAGTPTPKQNVLEITNPIPGLFKYVEIAAINYLDGGFTGMIIGRYVLTGVSPQQIIHTGFELGVTNLDIGTLNQVLISARFSRNIELLNNRLVKSNITLNPQIDLTPFFDTFTFSIERKVPSGNSVGNFIGGTLDVAEFMLSDNVYNNTSLMLNERYRWGAIAQYKNGNISPVFHIGDTIINTDNTQLGCTGALPNFNFTTGAIGSQQPYIFYIEWGGYNINQIIDGVAIKDVVERIYIVRCEVTNPQVLATGVAIPAVSNHVGVDPTDYFTWVDVGATIDQFGEFPFVAGVNETLFPDIPVNYAYGSTAAPEDFAYHRDYASLYLTDVFMGHTAITGLAGDVIKNFGMATALRQAYGVTIPGYDNDYYIELNGETGAPVDVDATQVASIARAGTATLNGNLYSKRGLLVRVPPGVADVFTAPDGLVVYSATGTFNPITANPDYAIYNVQYFREITNADTQYGALADSVYLYMGTFVDIDDNTPVTFDAIGGDVFTQKVYFKNRYPELPNAEIGFGQGLSFYSQNRVNFQMRDPNAGATTPTAFPASSGATAQDQINTWLNNHIVESLSYNEGYTIRNEITSYRAFDTNAEYQIDWGNAEWWSQPEAEGAVTDQLRIFMPLDIHFEDYTFGYITDFRNVNEKAMVVQQRKVTHAYFNDSAVLTTQAGSEVITGDGGIMNQKGQTVTTYGSSHKWSVLLGKSNRGNDVLYGWDQYNRVFWRHGYDGTDVISDMQLIKAFCANNMRFVFDKDTPAHEQGVCGVSNNRFREMIWTFRGWKSEVQEWTQPSFNLLHQHDDTTGNLPFGDLVNVNGVLYGTTTLGGTTSAGVIFSYNPATSVYAMLFEFTFGSVAEGYAPAAGLCLASNGLLYGVTNFGGANGVGTIFSFNTATVTFTKLYDMVLATGGNSVAELIEFGGKLYGQASTGGANGFGAIFEWDFAGSAYADVYDFNAIDGTDPIGKLYADGAFLYGLTNTGGANSGGTIFQFDLITFTKLHDFTIGSSPRKGVTAIGTTLYGTTFAGGLYSLGVLFSFDTSTFVYTVLHNFSNTPPDGTEPQCTPTAQGTMLFGTTKTGGSTGWGVIWQYNTVTNAYTKIYDFPLPNGAYPMGQMVLIGNILYGGATQGGINFGTLYSYVLDGYYVIGDVVSFGTTAFEQIPAYWIALQDNVSDSPPGADDPPSWEQIAVTDNRFYSFFTIVYSELKDVFQMFLTPRPRIYAKYLDHYTVPRPISNSGQMYENNRGNILEWFNDGSTSQVGEAHFDHVVNSEPRLVKTFANIRYYSDGKPDAVEFTTQSGQSYLVNGDFRTRENFHDSKIKNDSTVTVANPLGLNNQRTGSLWGSYLIVRTKLGAVYNKINSAVVKWSSRSRKWDK